jgi:pSer/pThr/pTyr-binding forkhead associated (FHA) protein
MTTVWLVYRGASMKLSLSRETTVGRSPYCTVVVCEAQASRQHALIRPVSGGLEIVDAGSRNGTRVNGERIAAAHRLAHGDLIEIGGGQLRVTFSQHEAVSDSTWPKASTGERDVPTQTHSVELSDDE